MGCEFEKFVAFEVYLRNGCTVERQGCRSYVGAAYREMRPLAPFLTGAGMLAIIFVVPFFRMSKAKGKDNNGGRTQRPGRDPLENLAEEISQAMQGTTVEVAQTFKG